MKRDYKDEYRKYGKTKKAKKISAELRPELCRYHWGVVQLVRASVLYTGSLGFESRRPNILI